MKMKITPEWLLKNADRDQDLEVAAGFLSDEKLEVVYGSQKQEQEEQIEDIESRLTALSKLINIRRRIQGWTLEQLADKADVDLQDVVCLEQGIPVHLSVRTIHKLSGVLNQSVRRIREIFGRGTRKVEFEKSICRKQSG